jgi:Na+/glutamate symporter
MSGAGFHVHGPHDHELEHAQQHAAHGASHEAAHDGVGGGGMINQIAMVTAVIATVGAVFAYMGGATQANAGLYKNNAAIKKTEASNQWNYFQSKSTKQSLAEVSRDLSPPDKQATYQAKVDRYEKEKKEIEIEARKMEEQATEWDKRSDEQMHQHHRWAQATTALQVSIALAAIALLTKKKWLEWGMFGVAGIGLAIGSLAILHV